MTNDDFKDLIWQQGHELYRDMAWRQDTRPYCVLVSELMLQQTQVERVKAKFETFIATFPDERTLARASLSDVLKLWQGLGYNRRAKFLHEAAKMIVNDFDGKFPDNNDELVKLPGVGKNTAGAILVYSFNQPAVFIETNIRTVYLHHFFPDGNIVGDKEITRLIQQTMPSGEGKEQSDKFSHKFDGAMGKTVGLFYGPREWYWALMDYGNFLKRSGRGHLNQSKHYKKQAPLKGSLREVRGQIVKTLTTQDMSKNQLAKYVIADERFEAALAGLMRDGLIAASLDKLHLTK